MAEDPLFRRVHNAVTDALGQDRRVSVPAEIIARRDGNVIMLEGYRVFINDEEVTEPRTYKKGDRIRTELIE